MKADGAPAALGLADVTKIYPNGTVALRSVDLQVAAGSVHGIVGANGAGKSTLIKVLTGAVPPTSGEIAWNGSAAAWHDPGHARAAGISAVHQHIPLVPTLSVIDNVFLPRRGMLRRGGKAIRAEYEALQDRVGYRLDADALVEDLSIGQRQMVAILQAIAGDARLVVMDEPTASLSVEERDVVFRTIRQLNRTAGIAFIYISHFLDEVLAICDHISVLRDGRVVASAAVGEWTEPALIDAVVGERVMKTITRPPGKRPGGGEPPALAVRNLASPGRLRDISFTVHRGEVVGIAGLLGSGRSELLHAIFGADRHRTGQVQVAGATLTGGPGSSVRAGVALVPEDRARQGLVADWEIWRNASLPFLASTARPGGITNRHAEAQRAEAAIRHLDIVAPSPDTAVRELSGGNAQKVVFAKWLYHDTRVYLLDEPTAGVDVAAKSEILALVREFANEGSGVLMVSSEFEELLIVCDRVLVMRNGSLVADLGTDAANEQELLALASGVAS